MKLLWDTEQTQTTLSLQNRAYAVAIRTAQTQGVKNAMTGLAVREPVYAAGINTGAIGHITTAQARMMQRGEVMFNVPEMVALSYQTPVGVFDFVFVWGLLLIGSGREKMPPAEQRLVLCLEHELGDVLDTVFELERILTPDEPQAATYSPRRRSA